MAARPATPPRRAVSARIADSDDLGARALGHHRRSTDGLLLERRPGLVGSRASFERGDRRADLRAIVGQPDGRQGIERLEDDEQVVGSKLVIDVRREHLAHAHRSGFADVELVEQHGETARLWRPLFHRVQMLDLVIIAKFEILGRQARHGPAGSIRDDHGNPHRLGIVRC